MIIDLHTHGLAGFDSRSDNPGDYLKWAAAMKAYGTDAFLPTLFPGPVEAMRGQLKAIRGAMSEQKSPTSPFHGRGAGGEGVFAVILGANIEGPFVNPRRKGALGPTDRPGEVGVFLTPSIDNLMRLIEGFEDIVKVITIAPELPGALKLIEYCADTGVAVNMGHSEATFEEARDGAAAGASGVTHLFNAMSGLHHREPGLAAYALMDDDLYVEIIADGVHVHPEMVKLVLKLKPPDKILLVSDSLGQAKTPAHPEPMPLYLPDEAGRPATLAGGGLTLAECVHRLTLLGVPEESARRFASENPGRFLGI
ncbi:MAG: N-acetylglucosamine-6-phosphate deacetylase [Nitrospirota bacterium]